MIYNIRKATVTDMDQLMQVYANARKIMRENGNPNQWGDDKPPKETLVEDIKKQNLYVVEVDGHVAGAFAFILGEDPTYGYIEGQWLNEEAYGTIHRIGSAGIAKGILEQCLDYCQKFTDNLRIDTHEDNKIMQHLVEKLGFQKCGIIYLEDGQPRLAYHRKHK